MKQFVQIFRQCGPALSPEQQTQRAGEVRAWAAAQNAAGRKLDPRLLDGAACQIPPLVESGMAGVGAGAPIVAITFLEAASFSEAVESARTHPGPRFGVSIEIREWTVPQPLASTAPAN